MNRIVILLASFISVLLINSCATILRKDLTQDVEFAPQQDGVNVYVNGDYKGKTPIVLSLDPREKYDIKLTKESFVTQNFTMKSRVLPKWVAADIVGGGVVGSPITIAVDAITKKWKGFDNLDIPTKLLHWSEIEGVDDLGDDFIFRMDNLHFETNSAKITSDSYTNLDELVSFMKKNPNVKIEVRGHTDKTGTDAINKPLSENRAKAVVDYLVSKGITANRMSSKGFGSSMPLVQGTNKEANDKNRRVEVKIVK